MSMFTAMSTDLNDPAWVNYRSFFISMNANIAFDFSEEAKKMNLFGAENYLGDSFNLAKGLPMIRGKVLEFKPTFNQLKVFKGDEELLDEASQLNERLTNIKELTNNPYLKPVYDFFFGNSIPVAPFPEIERCLGLYP